MLTLHQRSKNSQPVSLGLEVLVRVVRKWRSSQCRSSCVLAPCHSTSSELEVWQHVLQTGWNSGYSLPCMDRLWDIIIHVLHDMR